MQNSQSYYPLVSRHVDEIIAYPPGGVISVSQFVAHASELAKRLPDRPYVINLSANRYEFLLTFCAAVIAGQCTLMPSSRQAKIVREVADDYPDCYTLGDTDLDGIERFDIDLTSLPAAATKEIPDIPQQQLCAIAFTSGSTGKPTPNRKYWKTLSAGALSNSDALLQGQVARLNMVATVPPQHMWGFETSIMLPLHANIAVSSITPFFPQDIVDAVQSLPEPRALVSSPVHLDALLSSHVEHVPIHRIFSATAPMSRDLARGLERRFAGKVIEIFGCSEAGTFASRKTSSEDLWQISPTFQLEITAEHVLIHAQHLPEDVILNDIVESVGEDQFRWLGRDQDMVNIAGKRGSLADLNHRLTSISGVVDGVIFMPEDDSKRLAALVVAPGMQPSDILEQLKQSIEPAFLPRPLYIVPMLPRQETGKLARKMLVRLFEQTRRIMAPQDEASTNS